MLRPTATFPASSPEVNEARRELKAAIAEKLDTSEEEQRRMADILRQAAGDIRKLDKAKKPTDDIDLG